MIPLIYRGQGQFRCEGYHARRCDKLYGQGEEVLMEPTEDRSAASHRHYFARIKELWMTLPEWLEEEFPSPEDLRKKALVDAGYFTEARFAFRTHGEAVRAASYMIELDRFIYFSFVGSVLICRKPKSQNQRSMKKKIFEQSKHDVLDTIERLLRAPHNNVVPFGQKET